MRTLAAITLALLVVATGARAIAADDKAAAKSEYLEGTRQYAIGDLQAALTSFKRAYLHYEDPAFLFNIAQCERALGQKSEALRAYRMFLLKTTGSPHRAEVEAIIAELQAALDQEKRAVEARRSPPPEPAPAHSQTEVAKTPLASPAPIVLTQARPASHPAKPGYKKWWVWTLVGVAVVGAGVGIGLGVGLRPTNNSTLGTIGPNSGYPQ